MKPLLTFALLLASAPSLAAEKLCTGTHGEFKGYEIRISTSLGKLTVSSMPSNRGYIAFAGEYKANLRERRQPMAPLQLGFEGFEEGGYNYFWMANTLLEKGTAGPLEVTHHDEGSLVTHFHCKDF